MVRAEHDDQFRVVLGDELAGGGECGFDVRGQFAGGCESSSNGLCDAATRASVMVFLIR
jgi:hypothetical protein